MEFWLRPIALAILLPAILYSYQDSIGDRAPVVTVRKGQFVITYDGLNPSEEDGPQHHTFELVYSAEGKRIKPRKMVDPKPQPHRVPLTHSPCVTFKGKEREYASGKDSTILGQRLHRALWIEHPWDFTKRTETALPLDVVGNILATEEPGIHGTEIALLWTDDDAYGSIYNDLKLSLLSRKGFKPALTKTLGRAAVSNGSRVPVWVNDRWWFAWQRVVCPQKKDADPVTWITLSNYDPKTDRVEHKGIHTSCYAGGYLSTAVMNDQMCLAWTGPTHTPPYYLAGVYVAFEKLPAPSH